MTAQKLIVGNWKMNGLQEQMHELADLVRRMAAAPNPFAKVVVCPPATLQIATREIVSGTTIEFGGQDCHAAAFGAHTGDISAEMFANLGASYMIVGHSERRTHHGETSEIVQEKAAAAIRAGLLPIICVGETEDIRDAGLAVTVVIDQILGSIPQGAKANEFCIAYEPVWAIGTGRTPSIEDVAAMHDAVRNTLSTLLPDGNATVPLLYGGSVNPSNAAALLSVSNVDGALVGGASLKADSFFAIINALQ